MLLALAILILILWAGGFAFATVGSIIHLLLVLALIMFLVHFFTDWGRPVGPGPTV